MSKVFSHSGATGDIIFSLPTIRAMGGGHLVITTGNYIMQQRAEAVKPLLEAQPYITGVSIGEAPAGSINLDKFRQYAGHHNNLVEAHFKGQGMPVESSWRDGWLTVPELSQLKPYCCIHWTSNYEDPDFDWSAEVNYLTGLSEEVYIIGTSAERHEFMKRFGPVMFADVDFLRAAQMIKQAVMFTGCYSSMSTIAMGLGREYRLVQAPGHTCSSLLMPREIIVNL